MDWKQRQRRPPRRQVQWHWLDWYQLHQWVFGGELQWRHAGQLHCRLLECDPQWEWDLHGFYELDWHQHQHGSLARLWLHHDERHGEMAWSIGDSPLHGMEEDEEKHQCQRVQEQHLSLSMRPFRRLRRWNGHLRAQWMEKLNLRGAIFVRFLLCWSCNGRTTGQPDSESDGWFGFISNENSYGVDCSFGCLAEKPGGVQI